MGDEGGVVKLLLEMMTYLEEHDWPDGSRTGDTAADLCAPPALDEPSEPEASRSETSQPWHEADEYEPAPGPAVRQFAGLAAGRARHRDERRRVLRLAGDKLHAIEERERLVRKEKDLRQHILLTNMAARLEAEARVERAARQGARPARSYSRTLGRSFCTRPTAPMASTAAAVADARPERKKRRRPDAADDLLGADVGELLGELPPSPPPSPPVDDDDETAVGSKRLRLFPFAGCENADPNSACEARACSPAPQHQVRFGGERPGCGAAAGFADFQHQFHQFHQLVPSLES